MVRKRGDLTENRDIGAILDDDLAMDEAMDAALLDAIEEHRLSGLPMVFSGATGQVELLSADEVLARINASADSEETPNR